MTHPTKALCPILLEDFRRIAVERKGESNFFTPSMIKTSVGRAIPLRIGESHYIGEDFEVRPYYAGHVLGAAMFYVRVGRESVLYTGDYNMTPDRHLGAASAELHLRPDVLITESTYATTLRDSKRARERDFLRNIHQCVATGGKVLIPVFALGRVQELCILVEAYWERMGLTVPIYFSAGMAESANEYYRIYIDWTNEKLRNDYPTRNMFDFKYNISYTSLTIVLGM
jgi:integrator complex subunit 11